MSSQPSPLPSPGPEPLLPSGGAAWLGSLFGASPGPRPGSGRQAWMVLLLVVDVLLLLGLYFGTVALRYEGAWDETFSRRVLATVLVTGIVPVLLVGGYDAHEDPQRFRFLCEHVIASAGALLVALVVVYAFAFYGTAGNSARSTVLVPLLAFPVLSIFYRRQLAIRRNLRRRANSGVCLVGDPEDTVPLATRLRAAGFTQPVFVLHDRAAVVEALLPRAGTAAAVPELEGRRIEYFVVAKPLESLEPALVRRLVAARFHGYPVYTAETFQVEVLRQVPPDSVGPEWAFAEGFRLNRRLTYDRAKRVLDVVGSAVALVVLAPVLALVALAVRLTSPGPVFFAQVRVGERERPFTLYKFRSMRVGSENGPKYTAEGDSRLTPIGAFIRRTRLDELPQFWNVLRGDLSVIGPRAEWIELVREYERKFPYYHFRHAIRPGITGWAQVNYPYGANDEDTRQKLGYDLYYIRHYSLLLDCMIVVKTIYTVVFGRGR